MRHPFQVSIVADSQSSVIIVAKRSTRERADEQASSIRDAIGNYNRDGIPSVVVTDLRELPAPDND
jgi:hypothetical protein